MVHEDQEGSGHEVTYNIDDGFSYRRKRSAISSISVNAPQLSDIVGGHFIDGFVDVNDIKDEDMLPTKTSTGTKMRMTVYNTYPEKGSFIIYCLKIKDIVIIYQKTFAT